jgi:hypothetical protein
VVAVVVVEVFCQVNGKYCYCHRVCAPFVFKQHIYGIL